MMTRDEILTALSIESFSIRRVFYHTLDAFTYRLADGTGEKVKVAWPEALGVLTPLEWNNAYQMTMVVKSSREAHARYDVSIRKRDD